MDVEGGVRDHLREDTGVSALVGQRVYFGVPASATYPLITVQRVGGGEDPSEAPVDLALIQIDCWGAERNKSQARAVADAVWDWARSIRGAVDLNMEVTAYGAVIENDISVPDPSDRPRYSITAQVMARAAA